MTGDSVSDHHRNDLLSHVKVNNRRATRTLDKEVQYDLADAMDYELADSGIGGSGELSTITVEINSSPSVSASTDTTSNTSVSEHNHNSIIRRESIEKLRELDETSELDVSRCPLDAVDCGTLPVSFRMDSSALEDCNDGVDEIKEQLSLVAMNNCVMSDDKLKELSDRPAESSCALDCLSFTIQCCECTIL